MYAKSVKLDKQLSVFDLYNILRTSKYLQSAVVLGN